MENITELLKTIDPSRIDEAVALLQSLRSRQPPPQLTTEASLPSGGSAPDADHGSPEPEQRASGELTSIGRVSAPLTESSLEAANTAAGDEDDLPLASIGHVLSLDEKKQARDTRKAEREAERDARRRAKEEEAALAKAELDARKAVGDDEKEGRRLLRDAERDARRAEREAEKEVRRKVREEELEAEREARQKAREAEKEAQKAPREAPNSLALFGFHSNAVKPEGNKNRLFSAFVQDKRVAPAALQFWLQPEERVPHKRGGVVVVEEEASVMNVPARGNRGGSAARRGAEQSWGPGMEEESSLLHPPVCLDPAPSPPLPPKAEVCVRDFNAMIEASSTAEGGPVRGLLRQCGCPFHAAVRDPYTAFDNEVVFAGFFAIGYDPCQSRPPYFGTHNHLQEGHLNEAELLQMARFPLQGGMPRLSNVDYEYDSGDDWDVMEGDEDIAASSSGDSDAAADLDSLDSEDLDFINDDSDEDDSDCDIQRKIMEARQRRLHRLRNKDKLVPSYSGPFVGIAVDEHPLRGFDELVRYAPLHSAYFAALLQQELSTVSPAGGGGVSGSSGTDGAAAAAVAGGDEEGLTAEEAEARRQRALMEAALKNRREMSEVEVKALRTLIAANSKVTTKMILGAFKDQHLCVGVARAEIGRTIKRYYDRRHGSLVLRETPWSATDERLFARVATAKKLTSTHTPGGGGGSGGGAAAAAGGGVDGEEEEGDDKDEDDEGDGADDDGADGGNEEALSTADAVTVVPAAAAAAAPRPSTATATADCVPQEAVVAEDEEADVRGQGPSPSPPILPRLVSLAGELVEEAGHPAPSPRHSGESRAEPTAVVVPRTKQMTLMDLLPPRAQAPPKRPREGERSEDADGGVTTSTSE